MGNKAVGCGGYWPVPEGGSSNTAMCLHTRHRFMQKDALQHLPQLLMDSVPLLLKLLLSLHSLSCLALLILLNSLPDCLFSDYLG